MALAVFVKRDLQMVQVMNGWPLLADFSGIELTTGSSTISKVNEIVKEFQIIDGASKSNKSKRAEWLRS